MRICYLRSVERNNNEAQLISDMLAGMDSPPNGYPEKRYTVSDVRMSSVQGSFHPYLLSNIQLSSLFN